MNPNMNHQQAQQPMQPIPPAVVAAVMQYHVADAGAPAPIPAISMDSSYDMDAIINSSQSVFPMVDDNVPAETTSST